MGDFLLIFLLLLLQIPAYAQLKLLSQNQVYRAGCKIDKSKIKPFLSPLNPYLNDYRWFDNIKTETATLDKHLKLTVSQQACIRHHIVWKLSIENVSPAEITSVKLFKYAVKAMDIVFYDDNEYNYLREKFLSLFLEKYKKYGPNTLFYFDFADDTYLFKLTLNDKEVSVAGEVVRFLYKEKIKLPGIKEYLDDGWYRPIE